MRAFLFAAVGLATSGAIAAEHFGGNLTIVQTLPLGQAQTLSAPENVVQYANVTNFTGSAFTNGGATQIGSNTITRLVADDITPTGANAGQDVLQIRFAVANLNTAAVSARPRLRFWNADGAGGGPGSYYNNPVNVGFSFNAISLPNGVSVLTADLGPNSFKMPGGTFWAGIVFDNNNGATGATVTQMNNIGVGLFNPPTVGSSTNVLFQSLVASGDSFFPVANPAGTIAGFPGGTPVANVGWQFSAVPEPSSFVLLLAGAAAGLRRLTR